MTAAASPSASPGARSSTVLQSGNYQGPRWEKKETIDSAATHLQIDTVKFSIWSQNEIERGGVIEPVNRELYNLALKVPHTLGVLDPRLGISHRTARCGTCGKIGDKCEGHFGHVHLVLPVFHIGYVKHCTQVMQSICKVCARLLLAPEERQKFLQRVRRAPPDNAAQKAMFRRIVDLCKRVKKCPYCEASNGNVRKPAGMSVKMTHERKDVEAWEKVTDLTPLTCLTLFDRMDPSDFEVLNILNPRNMLITNLPVPPVCLRGSVQLGDSGSNEDDLTMQIADIIFTNNNLKAQLDSGANVRTLMESWTWMQQQCAQLVDSSVSGVMAPGMRPIRSICSRLKGKEGRFRGNLSGKRVDFSARTVISPDPNIGIDEVCVPFFTAKKMTYPEKVCQANMKRLQACVRTGPDEHPGAAYVTTKDGKKHLGSLKYQYRKALAEDLQIGDIVERHMRTGDVVLFNRQPSLHRLSIMAHRARVMPWRTFRFNECVCAPYNADFDGDEMNMHLPQTEEARTEAIQLMGVQQNIVTPKDGEPVVCATQDFLTAAFLLTQRDVFLTRTKFCQACCFFTDADTPIDMPPPTIMKPVELWTGKQVIGVLLRPNKYSAHVMVNLEMMEKNAATSDGFDRNDGYVIFRNSELLAGNIGKKVLGGNKAGLFFRLIRDNSTRIAIDCMARLARLAARWLGDRGFTIGIDDVEPKPIVKTIKQGICDLRYKEVADLVDDFRAGRLQSKSGCTAAETLEAMTNGLLGGIREDVGKDCETRLPRFNKPRVMSTCGSKGSTLNLCQMMACVGQQNVGGQRIRDGFVNRTLPHFDVTSTAPKARGFVINSFYDGLEPSEFFFHTMGGREGLVDTAVKTAETGYMARRLMKALEDISFKYDMTARTSNGTIVQFVYGDDALAPPMMEGQNKPIDFKHTFQHVMSVTRTPAARRRGSKSKEDVLLPFEMAARTAEWADEHILKPIQERQGLGESANDESSEESNTLDGSHFVKSLNQFLSDKAEALAKERERHGLLPMRTAEEFAAAASASPKKDNEHIVKLLEDNGYAFKSYQLEAFVMSCGQKYRRALTEPGEAVGAVAAQSISEPATQMTLKTFHFAGVASMNVTLGVPRVKEIINAAKKISTPIINAQVEFPEDEAFVRLVKGRIEKVVLGNICKYIKEVYDPCGAYLSVKLDLDVIAAHQLEVTMDDIKEALVDRSALPSSLRLKEDCITIVNGEKLTLRPNKNSKELWFDLQALKGALPNVPVWGIKSCGRVVINKRKNLPGFELLIEGYGLDRVLAIPGVVGKSTQTNHVEELKLVLGIEAARMKIMSEVRAVMNAYGIGIDARHVMLLGDCMTYRGDVLGINRFGIAKMRSSTLMLASFERTTDHLFDAAVHGRSDKIEGVSECIIMGTPVRLGTGLFKLLHQVDVGELKAPRAPILQTLTKRKRDQAPPTPPPTRKRLA